MFKEFEQTASTVVYCQKGAISSIVAQNQYVFIFKTTNLCWNKCKHCCECSGPDQPKNFITKSVINNYIAQATEDKSFSKRVIFTGGEIMSAYKFAEENYVYDILDNAIDNGIGVNIKTNAGWAGTPVGERIFYDIENLVKKNAPDIVDRDSFKKLIPLEISLSLDRFHNDAINRNFRFLEHFANTDMNGATFTACISSFKRDTKMFSELLNKLKKAGISVEELSPLSSKGNNASVCLSLNGNLLVKYDNDAILFDGGRAKNIAGANHNTQPQFNILNNDRKILMAFDSFGNVTLGENCGKKITVPWRDPSGNARPLSDIRTDLVAATKTAEAEYLKQHWFFNKYLGIARKK